MAITAQDVKRLRDATSAGMMDAKKALEAKEEAIDDLKVTLKENIGLGRVVRFDAGPGNVLDTYLHVQSGRGVNGILIELANGTDELAHDIAVHIAFGKPRYLSRDE